MLQHVQIHLHMISRAQHTYENGIGRRAPKPGYAAVRPLPGPLSGPFVLKLEHGYHHLPVSALLTAKILFLGYPTKSFLLVSMSQQEVMIPLRLAQRFNTFVFGETLGSMAQDTSRSTTFVSKEASARCSSRRT